MSRSFAQSILNVRLPKSENGQILEGGNIATRHIRGGKSSPRKKYNHSKPRSRSKSSRHKHKHRRRHHRHRHYHTLHNNQSKYKLVKDKQANAYAFINKLFTLHQKQLHDNVRYVNGDSNRNPVQIVYVSQPTTSQISQPATTAVKNCCQKLQETQKLLKKSNDTQNQLNQRIKDIQSNLNKCESLKQTHTKQYKQQQELLNSCKKASKESQQKYKEFEEHVKKITSDLEKCDENIKKYVEAYVKLNDEYNLFQETSKKEYNILKNKINRDTEKQNKQLEFLKRQNKFNIKFQKIRDKKNKQIENLLQKEKESREKAEAEVARIKAQQADALNKYVSSSDEGPAPQPPPRAKRQQQPSSQDLLTGTQQEKPLSQDFTRIRKPRVRTQIQKQREQREQQREQQYQQQKQQEKQKKPKSVKDLLDQFYEDNGFSTNTGASTDDYISTGTDQNNNGWFSNYTTTDADSD